MWLLIVHVLINVLGLIFLMAGSFQILISTSKLKSKFLVEDIKNTPLENKSDKLESDLRGKNRLIEWGWYLYTFGVILGAFQAKITVGYYWTWDLKETFSLLTILGYLLYIIVEMKWNKRIRKLIILICLVLSIITLLAPVIAYSYHNPFTII